MANPFDQFDDAAGGATVMDAPPANPFDQFDEQPNPFDEFDAEPITIESSSSPAPGFFGQSMQKIATGTRQALQGARTTIGAATGSDGMTGAGLAGLAAAQAKAQAEQTPQDKALAAEMQANAAQFDAAKGFWNKAGEFTDYAGIVARNPGATFQMGLQSLPNALISIPAAVAGRAAGAIGGAAAGIKTGPGAIATGLGGALAGDVAANTIMEAGPAIYDNIMEATGGAARNWTPEQFSAYAKANPDLVNKGLKSGALRGGIIGSVDALSMGLAGRMIGGGTTAAGKLARGAGVTGLEVASEGFGEGLAGYADTGKVDSQAIVQEMAGGISTGIPTALAARAFSRPPITTQPAAESQSLESDPLADFAATLPEPPITTQPAAESQTSANPFDIYDDTETFQAPEGDLIADYGIQSSTVAPQQPPPSPGSAVFQTAQPEATLSQPEAGAPSETIPPVPGVPNAASRVSSTTQDVGPSGAQLTEPTKTTAPGGGQPESGQSSYSGPAFGGGAPARTRQTPVIPDAPYGGRDVLDFVNDNAIAVPQLILDVINERKGAQLPASSTGDFNWLKKYSVPKNYRKYLFGQNSGDQTSNINEVAQMAYEENLIDDPTPDALMGKILEVIDSRESYTRDMDAREKQLAEEEKALIAKEKAEAKRQNSWADQVISDSMETPFIGIDPKLMAAYTVKGASLIKEGFTTFAKWSAEMVQRFGAAVKEYLQGAWQAAMKNSQRGSIGGDPLDSRATSSPMASDSGAAQSSNEPSPGGLSEAGWSNALHEFDRSPGLTFRERAADAWRAAGEPANFNEWVESFRQQLFARTDAKQQDLAAGKVEYKGSGVSTIEWQNTKGLQLAPSYKVALGVPDNAVGTRIKAAGQNVKSLANAMAATLRGNGIVVAVDHAGTNSSYLSFPNTETRIRISDHNKGGPVAGLNKAQRSDAGAWAVSVKGSKSDVAERAYNALMDVIAAKDKNPAESQSASRGRSQGESSGMVSGTETISPQTPPSVNSNFESPGAEGRASGFTNLHPSGTTAGYLNTDIINHAADLIAGGIRDFAQWSAEMVQRFGNAVKEYLQGAWQAAMKNSEQGFIAGPRAMMSEQRKRSLDTAKAMAAAGKTSEEIRAITGWFPGKYDGKLRWEGSDEKATFKPTFKSLQNGNHPPGKIRSVSYRRNGQNWDVDLIPEGAQKTTDIIHLVDVDASVVRAVASPEVWSDMRAGKGTDDLMGSDLSINAKLLKKPFEFDGFNALPLSDIVDHPELFKAYPAAKDVFVKVDPSLNQGGSYATLDTGERVITVGKYKQMSTLVHEVQHWIQEQEEFAKGSSPGAFKPRKPMPDLEVLQQAEALLKWASEDTKGRTVTDYSSGRPPRYLGGEWHTAAIHLAQNPERLAELRKESDAASDPEASYRRTAGEIESRDVQARQYFTDEQRAAIAPYSSENIAPEDAIVMFGSTGPQLSVDPNEIKLTHEAERTRMEAEGQDPLPTGGQGTVEGWQAEAAEAVQQPGAAKALIKSLIAEPRPATPVEHYMLMNVAAAMDNELDRLDAVLADPTSAPAQRAQAAALRGDMLAERTELAVASQLAGSKAGAALGARSRGLDRGEVPPLAKMLADVTLIQDPTGKTPLTPEDRKVIETTHAKMADAEAKFNQNDEQGSKADLNAELAKLLKEAQDDIAAQKDIIETQRDILKDKGATVKLYTKSKEKLKSWADDGAAAMQELRDMGFFGQTNIGIDPSVIGKLARVVRGWMAKGTLNTADISAKLITAMGERDFMQVKKFLPQIFDKANQLAREDAKIKTPDDLKARARKSAAANKGAIPRSLARQLALAHITEHIQNNDKTLSAAKIAALVRADLEEFQPGITEREARDLISGYGQVPERNMEEARVALRDLAAQMQKLTQLEALKNREKLLKSGPQRDKPTPELRDLQKQVEDLKRETGYTGKTREEELASIRDRIKSSLENQIEDLERVLAGKQRPTAPREAVIYDAELNALKDLRDTLKGQVAEMPEHKLASEQRRNKAALKSAQKSEAEWNRRAKAMQWTKPGKPPQTFTDEVNAAKANAKAARANFEALKKAANPANDPEVKALRDFKRDTQRRINTINEKIAKGDFNPPKKTPRQIKHDAESDKLKHELALKKREWIDLKLKHRMDTMGWGGKGLELVRRLYHFTRALKAGGEFSGVLNQGAIPLASHPLLTAGSIPKMFKAFMSPQNETGIMDKIWMRGNAINGRYKRHRLAVRDHNDYSDMQAEGNFRSAWGEKVPFFAGAGRAYTTLLNHMRADLFDALVAKLETRKARRGEQVTDAELDMIAEEVNDSTGAGKLGFGKREISGTAKDLLGAVVFSPAFVASRARYLAGASLWGGTKDSRRLIAEERIRAMGGFAAMYALALALQGDDDDEMNATDPTDSSFMKVKFGQTYVDLLAGLQQIAVLFTRLAKGEMTSDGKTRSLTDGSGKDRGDVLMQFAKSKRSPGAAFVWDLMKGKDYANKPITPLDAAADLVTPMTWNSINELRKNEPLERAIPLSAGAFFGLRTDTRERR